MKVIASKLTGVDLLRDACGFTINSDSSMTLDKIYRCEHSPIRTQIFKVEMYDIPTFVSVHLVRHKIGVEHFVKSNREDRPGYSGDTGRNHPVNHMMLINAQSLIQMARKRSCRQAHPQTQVVMRMITNAIFEVDPDLAGYMVPECLYRNGCYELRSCGFYKQYVKP